MRFQTPSPLVTDTRAGKEAKLKAFICDALDMCGDDGRVTLVARGTDSPIATALAAALSQRNSSNFGLRVVLFDIDAIVEDHAVRSILDVQGADFRVLPDSRFAAAHEQLVIGAQHAWIGDCMRRDPAKRDAFEIYVSGDPVTFAHTANSFAKLWASGQPLKRQTPKAIAPHALVAGQTAMAPRDVIRSRRG